MTFYANCKGQEKAPGCGLYVGCLAYADDITLLSPTVLGMQRMLSTCDVYGKTYNLVFNCKKSAAITFMKNRYVKPFDPKFTLGSIVLSCHETVTHLGVILDSCCHDTADVEQGKEILWCGKFNGCEAGWFLYV